MSLVTVTCQDCGREMELNRFYVDGMLASGQLVRGQSRSQKVIRDTEGELGEMDHYEEKIFDICKTCKRTGEVRPGDPELLREQRIQQKIRLLHEMRPDLSFEQRVHAAVEEEFNPKYEPNTAFREYLVERYGL